MNDIDAELSSLLDAAQSLLSEGVMEHLHSLVRGGEPALAIEELCSYLVEEDAAVTPDLVQRIARIGERLRVDASYWSPLGAAPPAG